MVQVLRSLYYNTARELASMKKSEMSLSERVAYERALTNLEAMKLIIDKL